MLIVVVPWVISVPEPVRVELWPVTLKGPVIVRLSEPVRVPPFIVRLDRVWALPEARLSVPPLNARVLSVTLLFRLSVPPLTDNGARVPVTVPGRVSEPPATLNAAPVFAMSNRLLTVIVLLVVKEPVPLTFEPAPRVDVPPLKFRSAPEATVKMPVYVPLPPI